MKNQSVFNESSIWVVFIIVLLVASYVFKAIGPYLTIQGLLPISLLILCFSMISHFIMRRKKYLPYFNGNRIRFGFIIVFSLYAFSLLLIFIYLKAASK